jgi:hypothetical protein
MTDYDSQADRISSSVQEFRAKILRLLNSGWPHRIEVDDDTAKRAIALAAQLQNWDSWK